MAERVLPSPVGANPNYLSYPSLDTAQVNFTTGTSVAWPAANYILYVPFSPSATRTIARMGWLNGTTVTGSTSLQAGVYDEAWARLGTTGTVTQTGTSSFQGANTTGSFQIVAGNRYYLALTIDNNTSHVISYTNATAAGMTQGFGILSETPGGFGLPSTATPVLATSEVLAWVGCATTSTGW